MMSKRKLVAVGVMAGVLSGGLSQVHAGAAPERLFLQQITTHSAMVKWRGGDGDRVCYSRKLKDLSKKKWPRCVDGVETAGGHMEALLTGLAPDKDYYYSVGSSSGENQRFHTTPNSNKPPRDGNTHIFIVGDSGTQSELDDDDEPEHDGEAAEVLAGFQAYNAANGGEPVDLFLALGDNAYVAGTDAQWQESFFEIYPDILSRAFTVPTIGNHEMGYGPIDLCFFRDIPCGIIDIPLAGGSSSPDPDSYDSNGDFQPDGTGIPYLDIFSLPGAGESGGVPSGTEQYYSLDYGNVHVVSLDSQLTARDDTARAAMEQWLIADLANNTRDWTVVIFHHPPYTKGTNHDSDDTEESPVDRPIWDMRNEFTPVFEEYGVDVVYSGHSHSYERSYYLRGHTGKSTTFSAAKYAELVDGDPANPASGRPGEPYYQLSPTSGGIDDRVVYSVAGSSGKADVGGDDFGITDDEEWLRHAAHIEQPKDEDCDTEEGCHRGLGVKGSVVIDAGRHSLRARFVDVNGAVLDEYTIKR